MKTLLVTGSRGLIGHAVIKGLTLRNYDAAGYDWSYPTAHPDHGDIRDRDRLASAMRGVDGVLHFAAISRVQWGERDPSLCHAINVDGTRNVLATALASPRRPWVIVASSREVYGEPERLPITEDGPLRPINAYGRSKLAAEEATRQAAAHGLKTLLVRFSNVYGTVEDHPDRVVPAFARAAAQGRTLHVHGSANVFDFTHVEDVARGLLRLTERMEREGEPPPTLHFASGRPVALGELARLAADVGAAGARVVMEDALSNNVSRFVGDPGRAVEQLGWHARVGLTCGLRQLIREFREIGLEPTQTRFPSEAAVLVPETSGGQSGG